VRHGSREKNISVELVGFRKEYRIENSAHHVTSVVSDNGNLISPENITNGDKVPSNVLLVRELSKV
jgi:hypothetical protein